MDVRFILQILTLALTVTLNQGQLPNYCTDSDGTLSCDWYMDCLEAEYPCGSSGFALYYGKTICELYTGIRDRVSAQSQEWIDDYKRCLVRSFVEVQTYPGCDSIKELGLGIVAYCPGQVTEYDTYCDVDCNDWELSFWSLQNQYPVEINTDLYRLTAGYWSCYKSFYDREGYQCPRTLTRLAINVTQNSGVSSNNIGFDIVNQIAIRVGWQSVTIGWFGFGDFSVNTITVSMVYVDCILVSRSALGSYTGRRKRADPDDALQQAMDQMVTALEGGLLYDLNVDGVQVTVDSLEGCGNADCTEKTSFTAAAGPERSTAAPNLCQSPAPVLLVLMALHTMGSVFLYPQ